MAAHTLRGACGRVGWMARRRGSHPRSGRRGWHDAGHKNVWYLVRSQDGIRQKRPKRPKPPHKPPLRRFGRLCRTALTPRARDDRPPFFTARVGAPRAARRPPRRAARAARRRGARNAARRQVVNAVGFLVPFWPLVPRHSGLPFERRRWNDRPGLDGAEHVVVSLLPVRALAHGERHSP